MSAGFENATTKSVEVNAAPSRFSALVQPVSRLRKSSLVFHLAGSPLTMFIAQSRKRTARRARDGATWRLPIAAIEKYDCHAGNAMIIMPARIRQRVPRRRPRYERSAAEARRVKASKRVNCE